MAMTLMKRAISRTETVGAFRLSLNLLRNFSAAPAAASTPASENPSPDSNKPKRRKKKNLIEVAQFLPNWGIGYHMAKAHWNGISYEITKINLYKDGRHGKAWGIVHKDGLRAAEAPKKISGVHKRCWKYIPNLSKTAPATNSATAADVQAA
ncbi:Mitochondrial 28S ribosomal protein S34 [Arabidopsis suecica]|uniref:Mitochondrial 28S ribosomal protein S34 n=1 Tax=Arabidopsis suecica TaxID=45249 RepID=A0A8T1XUM2_ARASU|nr:Mitochondrial 28S ribosomal protein S34 [Arabidopsis suecica]KAG7538321.1 Mitochondrial 28S ribosomal protein S34 [Arabidopsis suecica]